MEATLNQENVQQDSALNPEALAYLLGALLLEDIEYPQPLQEIIHDVLDQHNGGGTFGLCGTLEEANCSRDLILEHYESNSIHGQAIATLSIYQLLTDVADEYLRFGVREMVLMHLIKHAQKKNRGLSSFVKLEEIAHRLDLSLGRYLGFNL
ncbi:MAG: hypothetical protein ABJG42_24450 [Vibrio splendidus]